MLPVRCRLDEVEEQGEVLASAVVVGELTCGARCRVRREENRENIRRQLEKIPIVPLDARFAERWTTPKEQPGARHPWLAR
jgi:predicted nucleic acid-binding protein